MPVERQAHNGNETPQYIQVQPFAYNEPNESNLSSISFLNPLARLRIENAIAASSSEAKPSS